MKAHCIETDVTFEGKRIDISFLYGNTDRYQWNPMEKNLNNYVIREDHGLLHATSTTLYVYKK